ncbi:hypothetical protein [Bifidobacterium parmae]|nr:hypothetical protein [Bifidobacterium parmae]
MLAKDVASSAAPILVKSLKWAVFNKSAASAAVAFSEASDAFSDFQTK